MSPSVCSSPVTYARAIPNSPGAHSIRRMALGDRTAMVPDPSVGPIPLPSQNWNRTGKPSLNNSRRSGPTTAAALVRSASGVRSAVGFNRSSVMPRIVLAHPAGVTGRLHVLGCALSRALVAGCDRCAPERGDPFEFWLGGT